MRVGSPSEPGLFPQPPAPSWAGEGGTHGLFPAALKTALGFMPSGGSTPSPWPTAGSGAAGDLAPSPALSALIAQIAQAHGLPPSLLAALVQVESGFSPTAISPAGAMGLTQLMPQTAAALGVTDPWDPVQNLNAGAQYLQEMWKRFGSLSLALAAYNAGPGAVEAWGGIPPYPETQAYVAKVLALARLPPNLGL